MSNEQRPEMAMFHAMGTARGWKPDQHSNLDDEVRLLAELSGCDPVLFYMQNDRHGDGITAGVFLSPEGLPLPDGPDAMAARFAGWLRELADQLCPPDRGYR
jgi:hypothetical protein